MHLRHRRAAVWLHPRVAAAVLGILGSAAPPALLLLGPAPAFGQESTASARTAKGLSFLDDGDFERAIKELDEAVKADPSSAPAQSALVRACLEAGDPVRALAAAKAGAAACPSSGSVLAALASAHLASGDAASARDAALKATQAPGSPAHAFLTLAETLLALDPAAFLAADKVFADALAVRPMDADLLAEQAVFLLNRNRAADGEAPARRAAELAPLRDEFRVLVVRVLLRQGKNPEAREMALAAAETYSTSAAVASIAGRTYEVVNEFAGGLPWFEKAAKLRPRRFEHQRNLGFVQAKVGQWKEAEATLRLAEKLSDRDVETKMHIGWVLNRQAKFAEALAAYDLVLKLQPDNLKALWYQADILVLLGKQKDAEKALGRLLALKPDHDEAMRLQAELAYKMGKGEETQKFLDQCLAVNPKNARALLLKGRLLNDLEDDEGTEKAFKDAVEADPTDPWPWLYLAEFNDDVMQKPVDALKAYRKFLELGGPDPDGAVKKTVENLAKETGL